MVAFVFNILGAHTRLDRPPVAGRAGNPPGGGGGGGGGPPPPPGGGGGGGGDGGGIIGERDGDDVQVWWLSAVRCDYNPLGVSGGISAQGEVGQLYKCQVMAVGQAVVSQPDGRGAAGYVEMFQRLKENQDDGTKG